MQFIWYPKCGTCRKAKKFLDDNGITYESRMMKEEHPGEEDLRRWQPLSGLPLKKFFNTSGQLYREMRLSEKLKEMSEDEMFALLASDGMLVKRPLLIDGDRVLVGFSEEQYKELLK